MLTDPNFYLVAIPAVALVGLSKGGLGGAFALIGVPLLAIAVPPMQAAAILLPILLVMDAVGLYIWRGYNNVATLKALVPGAIIGITVGWATSSLVSADAMRLMLGMMSVVFALRYFWESFHRSPTSESDEPVPERPVAGSLWGTLAGYASFIAHAGGPPFQIYVLPLRLDPLVYTGTSTRFFAIMNAVKVIPYFAIGELDTSNLTLSAALLPVALIATLAGARLVRLLKPAVFYPLMYVMVLLAGTKLLFDGLRAII